MSAHSLAELYSILSTLPIRPRLTPADAQRLIRRNVLETCKIVDLLAKDYIAILDHLADQRVIGGAIYDGVILYAAIKEGADSILTLNAGHFRKIFPQLTDRITVP